MNIIRRIAARAAATLLCVAAGAAPALAQSVQLTDSSATVLRGGSYAGTNFASDVLLSTRASSDASSMGECCNKCSGVQIWTLHRDDEY